MIPPANVIPENSVGKENEREQLELPKSPSSSISQQESKLQRLKRSLSFKTRSLRSKSADNFFQPRPSSDTLRLQVDLLPQHDPASHSFLEHVFKKPTFCDVCNHMIVGTTAKHGLRCKACKMSIHHKCANGVGQQRCMGKLPKGFRRYYSSPLLIQEQFGCIKEVMPIACGSKVDPVYEALRFGTSLAQKTKRTSTGSGSESPLRNSTSDLAEVPEEGVAHCSRAELTRKHSDSVFMPLENGTEHFPNTRDQKPEDSPVRPHLRKDVLQMKTCVALHRFVPQHSRDLEMRPGDRLLLLDDSREDWWKGVMEDRIGFFPSSCAQQVCGGDRVFRCLRTFIGCEEQGQITLKEGQICVGGVDERGGFLRVASGEKRGYVPTDILEDI
ncbi:hypothetical protein COCON_G00001390 [Conger conger]|uniref:SH3 and cysteine-rich domain-containing protein n=1 Tax=Conger conger TaxID=82655 RepID=A0A9Q1E0P4_CONCO|nr:hypothetical protein COCON_G00001390 [Conger conger]